MKKFTLAIMATLAFIAAPMAQAAVATKTFIADVAYAAHATVTQYMASVGMMAFLGNDSDPELAAAIKSLADKSTEMLESHKALTAAVTKANEEIAANKTVSAETQAKIEKLAEKCIALGDKVAEYEQKATQMQDDRIEIKSYGAQFIESDAFKAMLGGSVKSARMEIKAAIINATGQNQPLVTSQRLAGIIAPPERLLTVRDLLSVGQTNSNLIEYAQENVYTNNAAAQYASPARENVTKPESGITFLLKNAAVVTLAHWIPVSKQILADSPQLRSYIDGRLIYGLKLVEENQLLNGDGTAGSLLGLRNSANSVAYNRAKTADTKLDALRRAITQAQLADYPVDGIVLNPADWEAIELLKETTGGYVWSNPTSLAGPSIWGTKVVPTNAIPAGNFLVGAYKMGAQIWDREEANIQFSLENVDNFVKNMATILAEERLTLTVYRPQAFIRGTY